MSLLKSRAHGFQRPRHTQPRQFFDLDNHRHVYDIHIWKGDFSFYEMRSAATYRQIADRFEFAISWIKQVQGLDQLSCCAECGMEDRVAKVLSFSVSNWEGEEVLRESHDDLHWPEVFRTLKWAVKLLQEMPEPPQPCRSTSALILDRRIQIHGAR